MMQAPPPTFDAAGYRRWFETPLGRMVEADELRAVFALARIEPGTRVLDVGCGDGMYSIEATRRGGTVVGVDVDERTLVAARHRAGALTVDFASGDAVDLPFDDASFDVVLAVTVLCFVTDAERAVREMARVLKRGGRLVLADLGPWSAWAVERRVKAALGSSTWKQARFRGARELRGLLQTAGLTVEDVRGAVHYPPLLAVARRVSPIDFVLGARSRGMGAALVAVSATKRSSR